MKITYRNGAWMLGHLPVDAKLLGMTSFTIPGGDQRLVVSTSYGVWLADKGGQLFKMEEADDVFPIPGKEEMTDSLRHLWDKISEYHEPSCYYCGSREGGCCFCCGPDAPRP